MGLFLSMSGVVGGSEDSVVDALRNYAEENEGSLEEEELTTEDNGCAVPLEATQAAGVFLPYP